MLAPTAFTASACGAGDADDAMAEALDHTFEIHGDHRLVLDDEHVGRDLRGDLATGAIDQGVDLGRVARRGSARPRWERSLRPR